MKRRTVLGLIGPAAVLPPIVERLEDVRHGIDSMLASEPTEHDADDWEQAAATYASEVGTVRADHLLGELLADFEEIKRRITNANGPVRSRLVHAGGQLAALTAISLVNMREPRSAERWWRTASRAAAGVGDPALAALVSGRHAVYSLHTASSARVLALADAAVTRGRNVPGVGVISGLAARAQILAGDGRRSEADVALGEVKDMFERLPEAVVSNEHSQWHWGEQRLRHVESYVHAYAGRVPEAQAAYDAALGCYQSGSFQGPTQVALYQAVALIRSGDILGGVDHAVSIFNDLEHWQRADGLVLRSGEAALNTVPDHQRKHPHVAAAREMLRTIDNQ